MIEPIPTGPKNANSAAELLATSSSREALKERLVISKSSTYPPEKC